MVWPTSTFCPTTAKNPSNSTDADRRTGFKYTLHSLDENSLCSYSESNIGPESICFTAWSLLLQSYLGQRETCSIILDSHLNRCESKPAILWHPSFDKADTVLIALEKASQALIQRPNDWVTIHSEDVDIKSTVNTAVCFQRLMFVEELEGPVTPKGNK